MLTSSTSVIVSLADIFDVSAVTCRARLCPDLVHNAEETYKQAYRLAENLAPSNAVRLGLALNYSVFYHEIKRDVDQACHLACEVCIHKFH
jgi:hypothetical protein